MPKSIFIPPDARFSGIEVSWTPTARRIYISGWYDSMVGIEGCGFQLEEFFVALGITEKDCRKAFAALEVKP